MSLIHHLDATALIRLSILQLGGGYLYGLLLGFVADSIGATLGATAAFLLGRTVSCYLIIFIGISYGSVVFLFLHVFFSLLQHSTLILYLVKFDLSLWPCGFYYGAYVMMVPHGTLPYVIRFFFALPLCKSSVVTPVYMVDIPLNLVVQIGRSFVISKIKDYPKFRAVAIAIQRSGFKVRVLENFHLLAENHSTTIHYSFTKLLSLVYFVIRELTDRVIGL